MQDLILRHAKKYKIGLHPSWQSYEQHELIKEEKKILETASKTPITSSRQHYVKFDLPDTYRRLINIGITDDYSMGYGSINGFRASVASSFFWYDIEQENTTSLRLHPFCFMDANCHYEQHQSPEEGLQEFLYYQKQCSQVGGTFIPIFHNHFLGTDPLYEEWREMWEREIGRAHV